MYSKPVHDTFFPLDLVEMESREKVTHRAELRSAARKELNRITEATLTTLKSNFKSADELEETIRKLEQQIKTTYLNKTHLTSPNNKTRLTGARKRVTNMRAPVARGGAFRRAGLIAMASQPTGLAALSSHPLKNPAASTNIIPSKNKIPLPTNTWTILNLNKEKATVDNVQQKYRELALKHHPNKGGNEENFKKIGKAKNNAIRYITEKEAANKAAKAKAAEEKAAANAKAAAKAKVAEEKAAAKAAALAKKNANKAAKAELLGQIHQLLSSEPLNNIKAGKLLANYNTKYGGRFAINTANVRALRAKLKAVPPQFNEVAVRNALSKYIVATVKPKYNKALVNAILRQIPNLDKNTKQQLIRSQQSVPRRALGTLGTLGRRAGTAIGGATGILAAGALVAGVGLIAVPAILGLGAVATVYQLRKILSNPKATPAQKAAAQEALQNPTPPTQAQLANAPPSIPFLPGAQIPLGYSLQTNNKGITAYVKNNKALQSQIERLISQAGSNKGGPRGNGGGPRGNGGGIIFKPQITVGAARIGAQTFGGTRVGGQQMGSQRTSTGNVGGSRATMGNVGGPRATMGNVGGPVGGGVVTTTPEQLIRTSGGSEAVEKAIVALRSANGNVNKARSISQLPLKTFTNIYAMGGPVAAKKYVELRRRRRTVASKKKRVVRKPRKQYIKLTPYQFKRLTDHIKKNNLRKVLVKEITH